MEEAKRVVKHVVLAKFKDETPAEKIEELIKSYANLVNLIDPMKAFHWYLAIPSQSLFFQFIFFSPMPHQSFLFLFLLSG